MNCSNDILGETISSEEGIIELLIQYGADVSVQSTYGEDLHYYKKMIFSGKSNGFQWSNTAPHSYFQRYFAQRV